MNITTNRAELLHAVRRAVAVVPNSSPLEALKGVLFEVSAAGKSLVLTATNLEVTLKQKLACAAQEDDALIIDAKLLAGMLEKLPGDTVELRRDPGAPQLNIRSGKAQYNVSVWERSSFPKAEIPTVTKLVQASGIPSMAKRTVFAADEKNEKPMLKCVHIRFTQDGLRAAGSDGNCAGPEGKVKLSFNGMALSFQCTGAHGSAQDTITVAPLTGIPQGEYWYLTKRLSNCLRSLSGTATLGVAAGGMLTLDTESAFYMQTGVRPGAAQPAPKKAAKKPPAKKKAA